MADGVAITAGSGTTVSTDDAGASGHVQRVKLAYSADGSATHVTADADGLLVNLGSNNDVTVTGTVTANLAAGTNNIGDVDVLSSALPTGASTSAKQDTIIGHLDGVEGLLTTIDADTGTLAGAVSGSEIQVDVVGALPAGTNNIGDVDILSVVPGTSATSLGKAEDAAHSSGDTGVYALAVRDDSLAAHSGTDGDYESLHTTAEGALWTSPTGSTTGGHTIFRSLDLDETEEEVKNAAGTIYAILFTNTATSTRWLKMYNATAANVTVGSTTPAITFGLPGNSSDDISGAVPIPQGGIKFDTAITVAATTGVADADTGAPAANDVIVNILYR